MAEREKEQGGYLSRYPVKISLPQTDFELLGFIRISEGSFLGQAFIDIPLEWEGDKNKQFTRQNSQQLGGYYRGSILMNREYVREGIFQGVDGDGNKYTQILFSANFPIDKKQAIQLYEKGLNNDIKMEFFLKLFNEKTGFRIQSL